MENEPENDLITLQKGAKDAPLIDAAFFEKGRTYDYLLSVPEIIYLTQGAGILDLEDGASVELKMGFLYIFAAGRIVLHVKEELHLILCRVTEEPAIPFNDDFEDFEDLPAASGLLFASMEANLLLQHFYEGIFLYLNNGITEEKLLKAKITELFLIIRHSQSKCDYARFFSPLMSREYLFKMFVCRHAASISTVAKLARLTNMSPRMLNNRFREYMNISPKEFMHRQRIKCIRERLLDSSVPIKSIAYDYGISIQYLSYLCRKEFGMTPTEMRSGSASSEQKMNRFSENHN